MEAGPEAPQPGVAYPLVLGSTFDENAELDYMTMRLDFVPASADRSAQGNLTIDPEQHNAVLSIPSTADKNSEVEFQGVFGINRDGLDCIAVFDPDTKSFRLELVSGLATLRHMPGSKRDKANGGKLPRTSPVKPRKAAEQSVAPEQKQEDKQATVTDREDEEDKEEEDQDHDEVVEQPLAKKRKKGEAEKHQPVPEKGQLGDVAADFFHGGLD